MSNPILDKDGRPIPQQPSGIDSILFRWIMLMLLSLASKVLDKQEVMNIYKLVGETAGHSQIVDGFHTELIRLMDMRSAAKKQVQEEAKDE